MKKNSDMKKMSVENFAVLETIRKELQINSNEKTKESGQKFFKEQIQFYGVRNAVVHSIAKKHYSFIKNCDKKQIFALCDKLWQSGFMEESFIACDWSYYLRKSYEPQDFKQFEHWLESCVNNWASCDTFCNHTLGAFVEQFPDYLSCLKKWTQSDNRWIRRGAAVTLIIPAKRGKFLSDILEIANLLLMDTDDLVQKGYGWMLKEASKAHQNEIFNYVVNNKKKMPRTALRYAIEKLPPDLKEKAMSRG